MGIATILGGYLQFKKKMLNIISKQEMNYNRWSLFVELSLIEAGFYIQSFIHSLFLKDLSKSDYFKNYEKCDFLISKIRSIDNKEYCLDNFKEIRSRLCGDKENPISKLNLWNRID